MLTRRSLLGAMLAASCGPAIVRVASLMPVRPLAAQSLASSMAVDFDVANLSYTAAELHGPVSADRFSRFAELLRPGLEELFSAQYEARA